MLFLVNARPSFEIRNYSLTPLTMFKMLMLMLNCIKLNLCFRKEIRKFKNVLHKVSIGLKNTMFIIL